MFFKTKIKQSIFLQYSKKKLSKKTIENRLDSNLEN